MCLNDTPKNLNLSFRDASLLDLHSLKQLGLDAYKEYASVLTNEHWQVFTGFLEDELRLAELIGKSKVFVCLNNNTIIGMAYFVPSGNPWDVFQADWAYLRLVGVHPNYKGLGLGRTLTMKCIDYAKQTNEKIIALHTSEFMDAARHIYESLGFVKKEEIEPRFGKRYWLYIFKV